MKRILEVGGQLKISASFNGGPVDSSVSYTVPSSQSSVISVSQSGLVDAISEGTGTVEVRDAVSGSLISVIVFQVLNAQDFAFRQSLDSGQFQYSVGFSEGSGFPSEPSNGGVYISGSGVQTPAVSNIALGPSPLGPGLYVIDVRLQYDAAVSTFYWNTWLSAEHVNLPKTATGSGSLQTFLADSTTVTVTLPDTDTNFILTLGSGFNGVGSEWVGTDIGSGSFPVVASVSSSAF